MAERPFGRCPPGVPIDQGYIFANVPFPVWDEAGAGWKAVPSNGLVTSHECACEDYQRAINAGFGDKANKIDLQVAPIQSASRYSEEAIALILAGEHLERFFVHGGKSLPDSVVRIDEETAIPAYVLAGLKPITVLAPWQWRQLVIHLTVSQWHQKPEKILHPDLLKGTKQ